MGSLNLNLKMEKQNIQEILNRFNVGNTPLLRIEASKFGLDILVKDESPNPFGTFKDRKAIEVAEHAYNSGTDYVMAITSGNYGFSLAEFLHSIGIGTILFVDHDINESVANALKQKATVIPVDLEEEELTTEKLETIASNSIDLSGSKVINATNFYDDSYFGIFKEIKGELDRDKKLDYLILPCGSGELFAAALRYYHLSDTKVIAVTTDHRETKASMLYAKYKPSMRGVQKHENPEKYDLIKATESEITQAHKWTRTHNINSEPSAAAVLVALEKYKPLFKPSDTVVVINTGNGVNNFA